MKPVLPDELPEPQEPVKLYNLELECGVIGALLYYPDAYGKVSGQLRQTHFHEAFLGDVYQWIGEQHEAGGQGGEALQWACLQSVAGIDQGKATIAHCIALTLVPVDVPYAVKQLVSLAERRRLIGAAQQISTVAQVGGGDGLTAQAIDLITKDDQGELIAKRTVYQPLEAIGIEQGAEVAIAYAGTALLDQQIGGWQSGRLHIIGGRPGSGKTTVATSLMLKVAGRGHGVGYFSLEMTAREIAARMLADLAYGRDLMIPYNRIERHSLAEWEQRRVDDAMERLADLPIEIDDKAALTIGELRIAVQAMQRRFRERGLKLEVVVVDHLGLIRPSGDYVGNRVAETGEVSAGLKALAKDLNIAVVALCQLNRQVEGRENKRPTLADLRWGGEIEQDADVVLMIFREAYYDAGDKAALAEKLHELEILVRKNRSGRTGIVKMFCDMASSYVRDLEA